MSQPQQTTSVPTLHQPLHSKVSNYLNDQRRTGQFCDLVIELENGDHTVSGHFCVVGAQSQFIGGSHFVQKSLQFSIHNPLKVIIRNFNCAQCLQTIFDFFYEDIVSVAKEHETHFKTLAKMLAVTELQNLFLQVEGITAPDEGFSQDCIMGERMVVESNVEKQEDVNMVVDSIFGDQQNYFKLKNPRAASSSSKINYCVGCEFKCYRVQEMISHMTSCEASHLTCSLCEIGFLGWREYDSHLRKHSADAKKPFFCLDCDSRFMTRAALLVHHPKHSTVTPHQCPHCDKGFKWKHGLNSHLLIHSKEKHMLCDVCGYSTTHMKALKSHKLQHTDELFKCTYPGCTHRANRKENLKLHIETHKQERPFVCEVCGCKFSQSKNLKRHALKHSTEDTKRFKCELCAFCSHRKDKLKEHMQRVHTEKAVLLELPEMVENAFENNPEDKFDLPIIKTIINTEKDMGKSLQKIPRMRKPRKKAAEKRVSKRPLRVLAPKPVKVSTNILLDDSTSITPDKSKSAESQDK